MNGSDFGFSLATLNASLNGLSGLLLLCGFIAIRKKRVDLHWKFMVSAFGASVLFLVSYLTRVYLTGVHHYSGTGRTFYLTLLGTHTTLAAVTPFLAIRTLYLAARKRFEAHRQIARVALPIWLYVSVTGVVVYFMLYHVS